MSGKGGFLHSKQFKTIMKHFFGWGAAIVIIGALFKIQHYPGSDIMLPVGLGLEAVIFIVMIFVPDHPEYDWERVHPILSPDLTPEQLDSALRRLDSMIAAWNALGIRLGYPLPSSPDDSDLDEQTNVPDSSVEAIYTNLAIKLAPSYGKQVMPDTKATAKESYNTLLSIAAMPMQQQMPSTMPAGAGNKPWRISDTPFLTPPTDPVLAGRDGQIEFN